MAELNPPSPLASGDENLPVAQPRRDRRGAAADHRHRERAADLALGRMLAADVISPIDVPAHDNSAMDGYAFARRRPRGRRPDHAAAWGRGVRRHALRRHVAPASACAS
jgi:molybdopterin biosynthesis enzyme